MFDLVIIIINNIFILFNLQRFVCIFLRSFFFLFLLYFTDELGELRLGILGKFLRVVILNACSFVEDHDFVTVDDGVDPMGDGEDSRILKGLLHEGLDLFLSFDVYVGSGLIQEHNLVLSQDRSSDADQLLLSSAQTVRVSEFEVDAGTITQVLLDVKFGIIGVWLLRSTRE